MTSESSRAGGQRTTPEDLHGTWELVEFAVLVDGAVRFYPLGKDPAGQIIYQSDGHVSALLMARGRPWVSGQSFLESTVEERGQAALGFVGYGGRFTLGDETVVHHVELSLYVEHVGTDLVRTVSWVDGQLVLETEKQATPSGRMRWQRLVWKRAG